MCRAIHSAEDFAQALRAIGEPIHGHRASEISMAQLLALLFEVTEIFDMQTRPELVLLQKTMVVVEGVGRDARSASSTCGRRPSRWSREWIERNLGPAGRLQSSSRRRCRQLGALRRPAARALPAAPSASRQELDRHGRGDGVRLDPRDASRASATPRRRQHALRPRRALVVAIALVAIAAALREARALYRCYMARRM